MLQSAKENRGNLGIGEIAVYAHRGRSYMEFRATEVKRRIIREGKGSSEK